MDRAALLHWAWVLTLVGALLIPAFALVSLGMMALMFGLAPAGPVPFVGGVLAAMLVWSLVTAAVVLVAALRIRDRPDDAGTWGIVAIVGGVLSFAGMGGLGGLSAILGGIFALVAAQPRGA